MIVFPPFEAGANQLTVTSEVPGTPVTESGTVGAPTIPTGVTAREATEAGPEPFVFVATTLKV